MTAQLALFDDDSLPVSPGTHVQVAVVFTALAGPRKGEQVYQPQTRHHSREWLDWYATEHLPPEANARLMQRVINIGEWEEL